MRLSDPPLSPSSPRSQKKSRAKKQVIEPLRRWTIYLKKEEFLDLPWLIFFLVLSRETRFVSLETISGIPNHACGLSLRNNTCVHFSLFLSFRLLGARKSSLVSLKTSDKHLPPFLNTFLFPDQLRNFFPKLCCFLRVLKFLPDSKRLLVGSLSHASLKTGRRH